VFGFYAHSASPPVIFALDGTVLDTVVTARAAAGDRYASLAVTVSNLATASPFQHIITCTLADNDHMYGRSLTLVSNIETTIATAGRTSFGIDPAAPGQWKNGAVLVGSASFSLSGANYLQENQSQGDQLAFYPVLQPGSYTMVALKTVINPNNSVNPNKSNYPNHPNNSNGPNNPNHPNPIAPITLTTHKVPMTRTILNTRTTVKGPKYPNHLDHPNHPNDPKKH
jgi:hypothetical protein